MYQLYLLQCADKTFYTGITVDLARRVKEHNESKKGAKYTRARRPVRLVYSQRFKDRSAASKAEYALKQLSHQEKLQILAQINIS
jgi:putative endonuclease